MVSTSSGTVSRLKAYFCRALLTRIVILLLSAKATCPAMFQTTVCPGLVQWAITPGTVCTAHNEVAFGSSIMKSGRKGKDALPS
jgi:hypothetical protein